METKEETNCKNEELLLEVVLNTYEEGKSDEFFIKERIEERLLKAHHNKNIVEKYLVENPVLLENAEVADDWNELLIWVSDELNKVQSLTKTTINQE